MARRPALAQNQPILCTISFSDLYNYQDFFLPHAPLITNYTVKESGIVKLYYRHSTWIVYCLETLHSLIVPTQVTFFTVCFGFAVSLIISI